MRPLRDNLIVEKPPAVTEEVRASGLVIPASIADASGLATVRVLAVGTGFVTANGIRVPPEVSVGDLVLVNRQRGTPVVQDGVDAMLIREADVIGVA